LLKSNLFVFYHQTDEQKANSIAKSAAYFILNNSAPILSTFSKIYLYEKDSSASECFVRTDYSIEPNAKN
jgi:hypothetical protein